ncbi:Phage protein [Sinorhizobium sojae CCBAU 05684]|uniref:Phage protein n=1 Tax=Sinorhizobium sojae CCBAU 05684 TaxID=716928 RepID=A0A249PEX4_9HYPH|nr:phage tail tip lysozyme [Sinorhizobium sojae]ASY64481.1 Phage protein [Sinorhizobium sojae CCBAU 05684]
MAKLPEIQPRGAITRGPVSSVSPAEVANPFQQIANALDAAGEVFERKDVADASNDGANAVYRDADGNLKVDLQSNISARGRAYNAAAQQGYAARLAGDIRARGTALQNEAKGNVDTFNASWKAFRDQTLTAVPKDFRGAVTTMLDTEGPRFALGVSEQKRTADLKEFEGNIKAEIQLLDDDMSALARAGGVSTDAYKQKQSQLHTLWDQLATNPDFVVGEKEAKIAVQRMESRHLSESMLSTVDRALATGGIAEARKISRSILTDEKLALTPAERRQYAGLANERINGFAAQAKANLKPTQDRSKTIQKRLKEGVGLDNDDIDLTAAELARGGDMAGAMELYSARAMARTLQTFKLSDNEQQVAMAETAIGNANRPSPGRSRPVSVAPQLSGRMQQAMKHYIARGGSPVMAAGIIGNLVQESSLNTSALNPGDGTDGSDSIGLGQWNGPRAKALKAFAAKRGASPDDFSTQLDFVLHELETTEGAAYERLKAARTVDEATAAMIGYERPAGWSPGNPRGGHGWNNRLAMAAKAAEFEGLSGELIAAESGAVDPELVKEYRAEMTRDSKALFDDIKSGYDKGLTPAVSDIDLLTRQLAIVDDQDFRKQVADYFSSQAATEAIAGMAPAQVENLISALRSDAADGATIAQQQIITGMEEAEKARAQALKDDPLGYAMNRRIVPPLPPLDLSQPDTWAQSFQAYQNGVDVLRARGEVGNISALRPEIQAQVQRALAGATPQQSVQLLGAMAQGLSPDTYQATLSKIAASGDGKATAAAGALVMENPEVAEGVLRGTALLRENPRLAPSKTDANLSAIDDILPTRAFAPSLEASRQSLLEAATARYADLSNQSGDTSGQLSDERMQQAITEVTGGLVDMNGYSVIAPRYGQTQDDFDKTLTALTDQDLAGAVTSSGQAVRASDLRNEGRLRAIADGRYILEFGNADYPTYVMRQPSPGSYTEPSVFVLDLRNR